MSNDWPPHAPDVNKAFEAAHDGKAEEKEAAQPSEIVTRQGIEALEKVLKKTKPEPHLTPTGMKPAVQIDQERLERLERMKQRLQEAQGRAREDFGRVAEREM